MRKLILTLLFAIAVYPVFAGEPNNSSERAGQDKREAERAEIMRKRTEQMYERRAKEETGYKQQVDAKISQEIPNKDNAEKRDREQYERNVEQARAVQRGENQRPEFNPKRTDDYIARDRAQQSEHDRREEESLTEEQKRKRAEAGQEQARAEARVRVESK
jgi:hypothetical protein